MHLGVREVRGVQPDGFTQVLFRFLQLAELQQGHSQLRMRQCVLRLAQNRMLVVRCGFLKLHQVDEHAAQVHERGIEVRIRFE